jgi:peptide/nickel transport system permease protein
MSGSTLASATTSLALPAERRTLGPMGRLLRRFWRNRLAVAALVVLAVVHVLVGLAPWIAPYGPEAVELFKRLQPPSREHWLGTDEYGRDVLTRLLYGGRVSLAVALWSMAASIAIGVAVGAAAGYAGGPTDAVLMRITDGMLAVPLFFVALMALATFGATLVNLVVVIALSSWMTVARAVRAEVLRTRELDFVTAARALGCGRWRIVARHVVPQSIPSITVAATLGVAFAVLLESALSFLGLGVQPPTASWGSMVSDGKDALINAWWIATFPGLAIVLTVVCFNLLGDAARDALDPRLRS